MTTEDAYEELCAYTLTHGDPAFIHQHVVDAFAAQTANEQTKPIALTFALAGLYLHVERAVSGRQVQRFHMQMARTRRPWPAVLLPADRGAMTAADVMAAPAGPERDRAVDRWCASVWAAFATNRQTIARLLEEYGIV
jgi:hypothetical protein